jgi:hypothetical protein
LFSKKRERTARPKPLWVGRVFHRKEMKSIDEPDALRDEFDLPVHFRGNNKHPAPSLLLSMTESMLVIRSSKIR